MIEIALKVKNRMPFSSLSSEFPDVMIYRWCNSAVDYLEFHGTTSDLDRIQENITGIADSLGSHLVHENRSGNRISVMLACRCSVNNSTIRILESMNCLWQAPVTYRDGFESIVAIAFSEAEFSSVYDILKVEGEVQISRKSEIRPESLRDVFTIPVSTLLGKLTQKQLVNLRSAIDRGFFQNPRNVLIETLAADAGISKSTMQEHINKALNKTVAAIGPYLNLMIEYLAGKN